MPNNIAPLIRWLLIAVIVPLIGYFLVGGYELRRGHLQNKEPVVIFMVLLAAVIFGLIYAVKSEKLTEGHIENPLIAIRKRMEKDARDRDIT